MLELLVHAYLLLTTNPETAYKKIAELVPDAKQIIPFSIAKIADTRELIRQTQVSFAQKTVYLLENFDRTSVEAQNAFLKSLEEAQANIVYVLTAKGEEAVLPTIVSRCQVVRFKKGRTKSAEVDIAFAEIAKLTKREDAIAYLEKVTASLHQDLPENAYTLKYANESLARIKANANPTLQLTWFATQVSLQ